MRPEIDDWAFAYGEGDRYPDVPAWARVGWRKGSERALVLVDDPVHGEMEHLLEVGNVVEITGGTPLVEWLLRRAATDPWPAAVTTVGLHSADTSLLARLAGAPVAEKIRRLCIVDQPGASKVLAAPWSALEMLAIYDVTAETVAMLPLVPAISRITTLRLKSCSYCYSLRAALAPVLSVLGENMSELTLEKLAFNVPAAQALVDRCWPALRVLALYDCQFEGGGQALSRARFPALRHLDLSAQYVDDAGPDDIAVAGMIAGSPALVDLQASRTRVGDATAIAAATHGSNLETLNLGGTCVGDAGALAIARSVALGNLHELMLTGKFWFGFDAAHALVESANPTVAAYARREKGPIYDLQYWRPRWPWEDWDRRQRVRDTSYWPRGDVDAAIRSLEMAGLWPTFTIDRWFTWQNIELCECCGSSGWTAEGRCPMHRDTIIHPPERSARPSKVAIVEWMADFAERVAAVEGYAARMLDAAAVWMGRRGPGRVIWWLGPREVDDARRHGAPTGLDAAYAALGRPPYLDGDVWAHSCAREYAARVTADAVASTHLLDGRRFEDLPDLFGPAREIIELGARILQLDEEGILIRPCADWFRIGGDSRW